MKYFFKFEGHELKIIFTTLLIILFFQVIFVVLLVMNYYRPVILWIDEDSINGEDKIETIWKDTETRTDCKANKEKTQKEEKE
jgi:hypothetical protein